MGLAGVGLGTFVAAIAALLTAGCSGETISNASPDAAMGKIDRKPSLPEQFADVRLVVSVYVTGQVVVSQLDYAPVGHVDSFDNSAYQEIFADHPDRIVTNAELVVDGHRVHGGVEMLHIDAIHSRRYLTAHEVEEMTGYSFEKRLGLEHVC